MGKTSYAAGRYGCRLCTRAAWSEPMRNKIIEFDDYPLWNAVSKKVSPPLRFLVDDKISDGFAIDTFRDEGLYADLVARELVARASMA